MEAMISVVAPTLFPTLERSLQVAFVTGFAASCATSKRQVKPFLPNLPSRGRARRLSSKDEEGRPKAPPNDPQRQGNIWHRYEQLESMTKSLANVNKQMVLEKTKHQKEKKRLEEALLELQRVNESLLDAAHSSAEDRPEGAVVYSMSAESAQLLGELRSRQRVYCPVSGLERSAGASSADPHKDESKGVATAEQAQAIARLQKQLAESQDRRKHAETSNASLKAEIAELRTELTAQTENLELQVKALIAENDKLQSQVAKQRSTQESELKNLEAVQRELNERLEDLADEKKLLQEQLSKAQLAATEPDASMVRTLTEQNKALTVRNAQLEAQVAAEGRNERSRELEQAMADVQAENARLQAKIMRLNSSASAVAAAGELLEQLKKENAALSSNNERLLSYVEGLESAATGGLNSGTPRAHKKLLENFVQLKVDNKLLAEENARLASELAEVQHVRGGVTTVPVPVRVEDGEEVDRELWVLLEELQERKQALAAENTALRARTPTGSWKASEAELAAENERLHRQLAAVMEVRAAEINGDNLRLVNHLTEENVKLEQENQKYVNMLAASAKSENRGVLKDILNNVERLQRDKAKAMADNAELAKRNTRLIEESEALLMRCQATGDAQQQPSSPAVKKSKKGLFPFRRSGSKSVLSVHLLDGEAAAAQDSPRSQAGSTKSAGIDAEALQVECAHLHQENSRLLAENCQLSEQASMVPGLTNTNATLTAENSRLNDRMAKLVQDLTEENKHLLDENQHLNQTVQKMLSENAELSGRLIDVALTSDNDIFEAAFSKDNSSGSSGNGLVTVPLGHWSQEAAQKRRQEAEEEIRAVGRQQAARQQQRTELSHRASTELKAYERAKSSAENAYSKAKALALQRLNSRNSQLLRSGASGNQTSTAPAGSAAAAPPTPEQADDRVPFTDDGQYEEALRRRKEAELSRAQLQQKIESLRQARKSGQRTGEAPAGVPPGTASTQRAKAEAAHRKVMAHREADSKARASYFRFASNCDVAAFMHSLGYEMTSSKDARTATLFHTAVQVAQKSRQQSMSQDKQFLAEATISKLQEWLAEVQKEGVNL